MTDTATATPDPVADEPIDPKGYVLLRRDDAIATVTINRPAQRNAISFAMWTQLTELMRDLDADRDVRLCGDRRRGRRGVLGRRGHQRFRRVSQ